MFFTGVGIKCAPEQQVISIPGYGVVVESAVPQQGGKACDRTHGVRVLVVRMRCRLAA